MSESGEVRVIEKRRNPLLKRDEYLLQIDHRGGTPSRVELFEALSKRLGVPRERSVIAKIDTHYGANSSSVILRVYDDQHYLNSIEPHHIRKRNSVSPDKAEVKK
ncbi:MAG: hypothetical protein RMJ06_00230 [Nitrososphaerota archaeon]|nr:hypothetical protein [Nitrososphaerota archaeon]